jgi:HicB family
MSTLSLRLPESLHRRLSEVAKQEGVSINQLISAAVGEKMSALLTEEYLAARAGRGSRKAFLAALSNVPDVEPDAVDQRRSPAKPVRKAPRR